MSDEDKLQQFKSLLKGKKRKNHSLSCSFSLVSESLNIMHIRFIKLNIHIGYQSEIDNVTRRTKYSESSFLALYKVLADAPDPAPLFEAAIVCCIIIIIIIICRKRNNNLLLLL